MAQTRTSVAAIFITNSSIIRSNRVMRSSSFTSAVHVLPEDIFAEDIFAEDIFAEDIFAEDIFAEDIFANLGQIRENIFREIFSKMRYFSKYT